MNKKMIFFIFLLSFLKSFSYINIYPTNFDKRIDNDDGVQSFYISNNTKNPLSYRIYLERSKEKKDMTEWIEIYPKSVKLEVGETKEIKMQVIAPPKMEKGEYISNLVIKEIETPENREKNKNTRVRIFTELKIELAGYIGEVFPKFDIKDGKILNIGNIRSKVEIFLSDNKDNYKYIATLRLIQNEEKMLNELPITSKDIDKYKYIEIKDTKGKILFKSLLGEVYDKK